jgi:hypothetical protein
MDKINLCSHGLIDDVDLLEVVYHLGGSF